MENWMPVPRGFTMFSLGIDLEGYSFVCFYYGSLRFFVECCFSIFRPKPFPLMVITDKLSVIIEKTYLHEVDMKVEENTSDVMFIPENAKRVRIILNSNGIYMADFDCGSNF